MENLYKAIEYGDIELIKKIVSIDPLATNRMTDEDYYSPLAAAITNTERSYEIIEYLILNGADVNWKSRDGYTPLHCNIDISGETGSGDLPYQIARLLKAQGAEVEAKNFSYEWTPLMCAAIEGTTDEFAAILEIGGDYNVIYTEKAMPYFVRGQSLANVCIGIGEHEKISLLLQYGLKADSNLIKVGEESVIESETRNANYVAQVKRCINVLQEAMTNL
jgi:ankyrin repeat protein